MNSKRVFLAFSLLALFLSGLAVFLWLTYFRSPKITITSTIPTLSLNLKKKAQSNLVDHLATIRFWEKGVVYGEDEIEGSSTISGLDIIVTESEQGPSVSIYETDKGKETFR